MKTTWRKIFPGTSNLHSLWEGTMIVKSNIPCKFANPAPASDGEGHIGNTQNVW